MKKFGKLLAIVLAVAVLASVLCVSLVACNKDNKIAIGVQAGTTGESYVIGDSDWGFEGISNAKASAYKSIVSAFTDMKNGNLDYIIVDKAVAEANVGTDSQDFKIIPIDLTLEEYAIGVNKTNSALLNSVNEVIAEIKADGTLDAIYAAYANADSEDVLPEGSTYVGVESCDAGADDKLIVATEATFAPYEYKVGQKFYGIDMEIAKIIANKLGKNLYISDMDFDAVVTSVNTGDSDLALACLTVNAVRKQSVNFSTAYETGAAQVLVVKKSDTSFDACKTAEEVVEILKTK